MKQVLELILEDPLGFLLVCIGFAFVLRCAGTQEVLPKLVRFFELVLQRLWREFTKDRATRTAIEQIDFVLVILFGVIVLLATFCLLLPSALAQVFGGHGESQTSSFKCFMQCLLLFLGAGVASGTLVSVSDKDSAIRLMVQRLTKRSPKGPADSPSDPPDKPA